jgi:hypothetical protein
MSISRTGKIYSRRVPGIAALKRNTLPNIPEILYLFLVNDPIGN